MRPRARAQGGRGRRRAGAAALGLAAILGLLAAAGDLGAESWGGLTPGETTQAGVQALYGKPSRERSLVEEGRTVAEWTYAGPQAPRGLERMVVSFGLLAGGRFVPDMVRSVALHPKPHVFSLRAITNGWGRPDAIGTEEASGRSSFHYNTLGLIIILDRTGQWAEFLLFGPRQASARS
jgi:hypothetical protein